MKRLDRRHRSIHISEGPPAHQESRRHCDDHFLRIKVARAGRLDQCQGGKITGTFLGTPCRVSGARRGWTSRYCRAESRSCTSEPSEVARARWTCTASDQGLGLRVGLRTCWRTRWPHGLGHAGRAHRAGQRGLRATTCSRRAWTPRTVSCAALTATGTVAGARCRPQGLSGSSLCITAAASLEGVSQMVYILPERLLALVRPAFDLVLQRIRSLKRCAQACGCKIETPRYAPQFGSRLHFKRCQALQG